MKFGSDYNQLSKPKKKNLNQAKPKYWKPYAKLKVYQIVMINYQRQGIWRDQRYRQNLPYKCLGWRWQHLTMSLCPIPRYLFRCPYLVPLKIITSILLIYSTLSFSYIHTCIYYKKSKILNPRSVSLLRTCH